MDIEPESSAEGARRRKKSYRARKGTEDTSPTPKRKSHKKKRKPSIKQRLLKDLRAKRKDYNAKLRAIKRDIRSLSCKRKKKDE